MKHYTNFQNLTKFVSQHLVATHGHFHRHQFLTANYFFIRPDLSYLAVATATWQHCSEREYTAAASEEGGLTPRQVRHEQVFSQVTCFFDINLLHTSL
jgi:hypothetical protein